MAEVVNSLFGITPESLMAQRDEALQTQAMQYAKMDPFQRATAGIYIGANKLGGAIGGMLGGQDPELQKATALQGIMKQADTSTPEGLATLARTLGSQGFGQQAMQVMDKAQSLRLAGAKISAEEALAQQRLREKASADPFQKLLEKGVYKPSSLAKYQQSGDVQDLDFKDSDAKTQVVDTADGQLLINSSTGAIIANIGKKPTKPGIGAEIAAGLSPVLGAIAKGQAQKSGEAAGTDVGKQTAAIEGKYTALNSVQDALDVVNKGIYAGGYGPLQEGLAKYSGGVLADKQRLVNTEEFRAYIGDVVIPRLTEFGGNDSVEELKYLKSVMAGETTMESKAIQRILGKAKEKIQRGITRVQDQQKAIAKGEQLPTGPTGKKKMVTKTTRSGVTYTEEVEE
jgi:hypothetical protein